MIAVTINANANKCLVKGLVLKECVMLCWWVSKNQKFIIKEVDKGQSYTVRR